MFTQKYKIIFLIGIIFAFMHKHSTKTNKLNFGLKMSTCYTNIILLFFYQKANKLIYLLLLDELCKCNMLENIYI